MHIHDFHSKLASTDDGGALFVALRSLSRVEDTTAMFNSYIDPIITSEWPQWPAMDAHASDAASKGV